MGRIRINSCLVIILVIILIMGLALYGMIKKAIPFWRSITKPRAASIEIDPSVSIEGVGCAVQASGSA